VNSTDVLAGLKKVELSSRHAYYYMPTEAYSEVEGGGEDLISKAELIV
jgi:hypothetical protein